MAFTEDLSVFLSCDDFAVEVRCSAPARTFAAIFDEPGQIALAGGIILDNETPTITCRYADVADFIWRETELTVEGKGFYTVMAITDDGTGMATVELACV